MAIRAPDGANKRISFWSQLLTISPLLDSIDVLIAHVEIVMVEFGTLRYKCPKKLKIKRTILCNNVHLPLFVEVVVSRYLSVTIPKYCYPLR